ncbi:MAG TPA: ABC transporter permease [Bryobacteraceae bacterium]|nr:ABC transporter permease [Bryobacteraceae bacterium]
MADVRLALRQARKHLGYSLTCVAVLALGLAAATAVFSALYSTILKPLPYPEPDRLVVVHNRFPQLPRMGTSPLDYVELREHRELFSNAGAYYFLDLTRTGIERPVKVNAIAVTSSLFDTLGVHPLFGRTFTTDEERPQGPRAVILGERYWRSELAGDPDILNRTLQLDGQLYQIAGVMPQSFAFPNDVTQMWVPIAFRQDQLTHQQVFLRMEARLAPGVTLDQASARMAELSEQSSHDHPDARRSTGDGWSMFLSPMARDDDGSLRRWVTILFAAVMCLLLIVCSNVAGLLLVRSSERQFELSVRLALGASRVRIVRQLLTEILLLSIGGGAVGLLLARAGISLLSEYGPAGKLQFEAPVFWFGIAMSLVTGLVCGLYPAWSAARIPAADSLKAGGHQRTAGKRTWQQCLIVAQVALATTLLLCGGLLVQSLIRLLNVPLGFDPQNVLSIQIALPNIRYTTPEARGRFLSALLENVARIPGVESVSGCSLLPFGYGENVNTFEIAGQPKPPVPTFALINNVLPGYFETLRIPLLRGRYFATRDRPGSEPVALVDDTVARNFFANADPVGQQLRMPWGSFTIAGVVGGIKNNALDIENRPTIYFSAQQTPTPGTTLVIRSQIPVNMLAEDVQRMVTRIDPDEPVYDVVPLQTFVDRSVKARRFVASLMSVFAGAGIALAALGLFGLLAYMVAVRRREIGIRIAVGATGQAIALLVCRGGIPLVLAGTALGAAAAAGARRLIASQLYGTQFSDAWTWAAVLGIVIVSGLLACAGPAWRAARVDPTRALRDE